VKGAAFAQYSPTGHLLFVRGGTLFAVPMDRRAAAVHGEPVPIAANIASDAWIGGAVYAVGSDGTVVCLRGAFPQEAATPVWVNRAGVPAPAAGIVGSLPSGLRIAPDGTRAVFSAASPDGDSEVYVADLVRGTAVRLSRDPGDDFDAVWSPDGTHVVWTALPPGRMPLLKRRSADGSGAAEEILPEPNAQFPGSISPSGVLAYTQATQAGARDIFVVPLNGERKSRPFIATASTEYGPEFSPDGKWIAYVSDESGAADVYVAPYPGPGGYRRVSTGGGVSPAWSRDGRELFYQVPGALMAVDVRQGSAIEFGPPRRVFSGAFVIDSREDGPRAYDVSPDGRRFLMLMPTTSSVPPPAFHVLIDWAAQLPPK
jgi:dipeptidyl aminopeptidase/acylaminoacyl peptidase